MEKKYPLPPFTEETAKQKIQGAEDAWNSKDPVKVSKAYTVDTEWRNRDQFVNGRQEVQEFLADKWNQELDYKLKKELWAFQGNRIAVRFEYEYRNQAGEWFCALALSRGSRPNVVSCAHGPPTQKTSRKKRPTHLW